MTSHFHATAKRRPLCIVLLLIPILTTFVSISSTKISFAHTRSAHAVNRDCTLIVPANPLSAQGLATPYQLAATHPSSGACHEANTTQAAFVQGAILDTKTGQVWIYNPLVVDKGTTPASQPVVPFGGLLPPQDIVGLWFGTNSATLAVEGTHGSLQDGYCRTGGPDSSSFGQFASCNAVAFFQKATSAIQKGILVPPPVGMGKDGMVCPTVRDFSLVDQDQSDGVPTTYLVTDSGLLAQNTASNAKQLPGTVLTNANDNRLLVLVDRALDCTPWLVPDLTDTGNMVPSLPFNELQADMLQGDPMALIPNRNPMTLVKGKPSLSKLNAYREAVDQPQVQNSQQSNTTVYCRNLLNKAPARLKVDAQLFQQQPSPDRAIANSLLTFIAQRFTTTYGPTGLDCIDKITPVQPDPIVIIPDINGVAIEARYLGTPLGTVPSQPTKGTPTLSPVLSATPADRVKQSLMVNCVVNGNVLQDCTGTTEVRGVSCTLTEDTAKRQIIITCK